ncbi:MAG: hypothetical protein KDD55_07455, partial [Bdellovibrionales bacterium]|nr:hypothetical protein [Bdellovibrionales bacterium]
MVRFVLASCFSLLLPVSSLWAVPLSGQLPSGIQQVFGIAASSSSENLNKASSHSSFRLKMGKNRSRFGLLD